MMPWAILGLFILFLFVSYIIVQGTRSALAWRTAANEGDVKVIRDILEDAIKAWSLQKRPKEVRVEVWRGIQGMQAIEVAPGYLHVSTNAASEYRQDGGRWVEVSNPLQEGTEISAKAIDMLFYEVPNYKADAVHIDVYTQYRDEAGVTHHNCILSTIATRETARNVDWDEWTASEIVKEFGGISRLSDTGRPLPIEPLETPEEYRITEEETETSEAAA